MTSFCILRNINIRVFGPQKPENDAKMTKVAGVTQAEPWLTEGGGIFTTPKKSKAGSFFHNPEKIESQNSAPSSGSGGAKSLCRNSSLTHFRF